MIKQETCNKRVYIGSFNGHLCKNKVYKDGLCKIHQKESVEARRARSEQIWKEKQKQTPYYMLQVARKRIEFLEEAIAAKDNLIDELKGGQP